MRKLLKKSALPEQKKKTDFPNITHTFNDIWKWTCERTVDKFNTVTPVHVAPLPASKKYLDNYDRIFRKHKKDLEVC